MKNKLNRLVTLSLISLATVVGAPAVAMAAAPNGQMYVQSRVLTYEQGGKTVTARATYGHGTENYIAYVLPEYQLVGDTIESTANSKINMHIAQLTTPRDFRQAHVAARNELVTNGHVLGGNTKDAKYPPHSIVIYNTNRTNHMTDMFVFTSMNGKQMEFHMMYPTAWGTTGALGAMMNAVIVPSVPNKY